MGEWQTATALNIESISRDVKSFKFTFEKPVKFLAGQHFDFRLTAPNGYQAQRSYSAASAPEEERFIEFGVQILEDGEVSSYMDTMKPGDQIEIRGPLGRHFVWQAAVADRPLILIAGGSGFVPIMSMLRHYVNSKASNPLTILASFQSEQDILWRDELNEIVRKSSGIELQLALTRDWPAEWDGIKGRIDNGVVAATLEKYRNMMPELFICGRTMFVEDISNLLILHGFMPGEIKTERYG